MSEEKNIRISKVLKELNISLDRAVDFLKEKGISIDSNINGKISDSINQVLSDEFANDKGNKAASQEINEEKRKEREQIKLAKEKEERDRFEADEKRRQEEVIKAKSHLTGPVTIGKIDLNPKKPAVEPTKTEKVIEEKVVEEKPIIEKPIIEKPIIEKPIIEKPIVEKPIEVFAKTQPIEKIEENKVIETETKSSIEPKVESKITSPEIEIKKVEKPISENKVEKTNPVKEEKNIEPSNKKNTDKQTPISERRIGDDEGPIVVDEKFETQYQKLSGAKTTGQVIDLSKFEKPKKKEEPKKPFSHQRPNTPNNNTNTPNTNNVGNNQNNNASKRKRIIKPIPGNNTNAPAGNRNFNKPGFKPAPIQKVEPTEEEVQKQVRETLEKLQGKGSKSKAAKYRRDKRDSHRQKVDDELEAAELGSKTLKVTEFVTVGEVATLMDVPINKVIGTCMSLGIMVTMNQRLDAETLSIVADEFGFEVEFITTDIEEAMEVIEDKPEDLKPRSPIVTVMGHVDHGKTSLLDYIRKTNVIAGESGGITQHIGAYSVKLENNQKITFLDTPGHEAFTAMRARGAQLTDIAIIVVAADDDIMPQTKEAISHAQAANVPMIFAINKIDKPAANPEKIKEQLAQMNLLVEDWGGKIQSHDISAKQGIGINELLEKVLLEAEILELTANPDKPANGVVVEAFLDKGRGYVTTVLVQSGTLKVGDYVLAGKNHGKIKAMQDERGKSVKSAGPATPISILGLDNAPTAGDKFSVFEDEREAKQIASKRNQLQREQSVRTTKHITLTEIGRRIALGQFKELNIILKGDVDGSVEALSDSFSKLSTEEVQIKIILKGVGAITESDVMLASASDAIIIGFNVRPAGNAKQLAEKEEIDIRNYSIIYDAINDLKDAMEGMLSPEFQEEITGTAEIREIFKVTKLGNIAGCMVTDGKIFRANKIRIIREGVVIHTGELVALRRFKDDVKEVSKGYDCGIQFKNYNDIQYNDVIESFMQVEVKKKLK
jgi:translation initiation factor IF-2